MQIKIFSDTSLFDLEDSINMWLIINPKVDIIKMTQVVYQEKNNEPLHSISVIYNS